MVLAEQLIQTNKKSITGKYAYDNHIYIIHMLNLYYKMLIYIFNNICKALINNIIVSHFFKIYNIRLEENQSKHGQ